MLESTHTKADNVKNPPHVMQKICDLGLFLKLPLASILMAKSVPSKPTEDVFALFYTCKNQYHLQIELGICWVFLGEYTFSLRHSLNQVEAWIFQT